MASIPGAVLWVLPPISLAITNASDRRVCMAALCRILGAFHHHLLRDAHLREITFTIRVGSLEASKWAQSPIPSTEQLRGSGESYPEV